MLPTYDTIGRGPITSRERVVVKLGGSIVTDKATPFSYRGETVVRLAEKMARSGASLVVVHGGGSFGHPVAKRYGLSSRASMGSANGVSKTREAMFRLDQLVCASLTEGGLNPYPISPFDLLMKAGRSGAFWIESLMEAGLVPVTFGDVVREGAGFRILSGDTIAYDLCKLLAPDRCIFALDADGVYDKRGRVIPEVDGDSIGKLRLARADDATGGIRLKLREAAKIADLGVEADLVSGHKPREFAKSLRGLRFLGTRVKGHSQCPRTRVRKPRT